MGESIKFTVKLGLKKETPEQRIARLHASRKLGTQSHEKKTDFKRHPKHKGQKDY